jgi:hypothetical protein
MVAAAPVAAERAFVPLLEVVGADGATYGTEVQITNDGLDARGYAAAVLTTDATGSVERFGGRRLTVPQDAWVRIERGLAGVTGLLEIDADADLGFGAWIESRTAEGGISYAGLPVLGESNRYGAGSVATLAGLVRERRGAVTDLALVNLGEAGCACDVALYDGAGTELGRERASLAALSLRSLADALGAVGILEESGARAEVSCDQPFYALAVVRDAAPVPVAVLAPVAAGAPATAAELCTPAANEICYTKVGAFLKPRAIKGKEKILFWIPVPSALNLKRTIYDLDFLAGPWNPKRPKDGHSPLWANRGRFRSNSLANVNLFGPGKSRAKMNQNFDMPRGSKTVGDAPLVLEKGQRYHLKVTVDGSLRRTSLNISKGSLILAAVTLDNKAQKNVIAVTALGIQIHVGHNMGQHGPEANFVDGWEFYDFAARLVK